MTKSQMPIAHSHFYLSMIPIGLKPGILVGALLAAGVAGGDIEGHYLTIGTAVAIFSAVAVSAWNLGGKFRRILDQLEETQKELEASKEDRKAIHEALKSYEKGTDGFRGRIESRLLSIDKTIAGLKCNPTKSGCPVESEDS